MQLLYERCIATAMQKRRFPSAPCVALFKDTFPREFPTRHIKKEGRAAAQQGIVMATKLEQLRAQQKAIAAAIKAAERAEKKRGEAEHKKALLSVVDGAIRAGLTAAQLQAALDGIAGASRQAVASDSAAPVIGGQHV